jgi:hypothetical protein
MMKRRKSMSSRLAIGAGAVLVFLFLYIDDWSRDFTTNIAEFSVQEAGPYVEPLLTGGRSVPEVLEAVRMAVGRIRSWEYIGETVDGNRTTLIFVRTNRMLRFKDDITIRVENLGDRWRLSGESRSRFGIGDLGRNPRNLKRFLEELHAVGSGSARGSLVDAVAPRSHP